MRILLIEDSKRLQTYVSKGLRHAGYAVDVTGDGEEGLYLAESGDYDVIVLDLTLPNLDGMEILRALRSRNQPVYVLILTARDTVEDRVKGLQDGADDYLIKPFSFDELLARIQALLRRKYAVPASTVQVGDLSINLTQRVVMREGTLLDMKPREYALLEYLALRKGALVTRAKIEQHIYDERAEPMSNVVDSAICSLRKIIDLPGRPSLIQTRRGMGYIMAEDIK